jgi:AbrB family looped-hinge helix DNA binding protein
VEKTRAKVTSKGQVTIPKGVRQELALRPGDEIEFVKEDGAYHVRRVVDESAFQKWHGYLKEWAGYDVDEMIEEMRGR